ncbi:DUF4190 domain-containing protein [Streptomyces sp. NPDC057638]|uniref:DUF4190 domain-containing protein n=1 Tax=Streptomyces sp. NPDC057638 TaxID=3346190 RepID=UPI0036AD5F66
MSHSTHQQPYGAPSPQGQPAPRPMRNGLGTAALILGIIGALSGLIPLLFWMAGILGLIAVILGLVGNGRVKRGEANNRGVTLTGAVMGLVALVLSVIGMVITFKAVDDAVDEIDKALTPTGTKDDGGKKGTDDVLAPGKTAIYKDDLKITVSAPKSFQPSEYAVGHAKGNKGYQVTVTIENAGTKKFEATLITADARAGADGATAEQIFDEKAGSGFTGTILPGKKATATYAFSAPAAAKTLTVEMSPGLMHDETQWELPL